MVPVVGRAMAARVALAERSVTGAPAVTVGLMVLVEVEARAFPARVSVFREFSVPPLTTIAVGVGKTLPARVAF